MTNRLRVRVNQTAGGSLKPPPFKAVTVRTVAVDGSAGGQVDELSDLLDVDAANPATGEILVYNENTGKYESVPFSVDGGTF